MEYFGDKYLEFHDFLNDLTLDECIEVEINTHAGIILPNELAYYIGAKDKLMNQIKCVRELKKETDPKKQQEILKKYNIQSAQQLQQQNENSYIT